MTRFTIHIPRNYNTGKPVEQAILDTLESELLATAGGFTRTEAVGGYRAPDGTEYRDDVYVYAMDGEPGYLRPRLLATADAVAIALDQACVYMTAQPVEAQLVTPNRLPLAVRS